MLTFSDRDISRNLGIHRVIEPAGFLPQAAWKLDNIDAIHLDRSEVEVTGKAIFFRTNPLAKLPGDLSRNVVVAALDVAGAPSRAAMLVQPGQRITVLGAGGTAGLLTLCAVRQRLGSQGEIIAVEYSEQALHDVASLNVADVLVQGNA